MATGERRYALSYLPRIGGLPLIEALPPDLADNYHPDPMPIVPVKLRGVGSRVVYTDALVDSGSAESVLPVEYIDDLNIPHDSCFVSQKQEQRQEGEPVEMLECLEPVKAEVAGVEFPLRFHFATVKQPFVILGLADLFQEFKIEFDRRYFTLTPRGASEG